MTTTMVAKEMRVLETVQGIISAENKKTTSTKTLIPLNCEVDVGTFDRTKDTAITRTISLSGERNLGKPVDVCNNCGQPLQKDYLMLGTIKRMPIICQCRVEELKREKERDGFKKQQKRISKFKAYSLMDDRFKESTFENWKFRNDNRELYDFGKRYCDNWGIMKKNNRGLLIHGVAGNRKTYLSFAIANELYNRGITVLAISVSRILRIIMDSYKQNGEIGEMDILNTIYEADLLILDDLGIENKTFWSYDKLYSIVDTRCSAKKPMIITTNLSGEELRKNLAIVDIKTRTYDNENRIYDRIVGMCTHIKAKGGSWRIQKGEENQMALFRELGLTKN